MPVIVRCVCSEVLAVFREELPVLEIVIEQLHGRCPSCKRLLRLPPVKVTVKPYIKSPFDAQKVLLRTWQKGG